MVLSLRSSIPWKQSKRDGVAHRKKVQRTRRLKQRRRYQKKLWASTATQSYLPRKSSQRQQQPMVRQQTEVILCLLHRCSTLLCGCNFRTASRGGPCNITKVVEKVRAQGYLVQSLKGFHRGQIMAHANSLQHRGGMDFYALARGGERSYSTSFLINLDPDLLSLCTTDSSQTNSTYQLCRQALTAHTQRIFKMIKAKSKRDINQFCFGSTYIQLNPNYRKFDRMDPMTWKKEGISSHWTGVRGFRKKCCKACCLDLTCNGCGVCKGCTNR